MARNPAQESLFPARLKWLSHLSIGAAAAILTVFYLSATIHNYFRFAEYAPGMATDDSLGNISVYLAEKGRYGGPALPLQPSLDDWRIDTYYSDAPRP